jgi:hypothetical protein
LREQEKIESGDKHKLRDQEKKEGREIKRAGKKTQIEREEVIKRD